MRRFKFIVDELNNEDQEIHTIDSTLVQMLSTKIGEESANEKSNRSQTLLL